MAVFDCKIKKVDSRKKNSGSHPTGRVRILWGWQIYALNYDIFKVMEFVLDRYHRIYSRNHKTKYEYFILQ